MILFIVNKCPALVAFFYLDVITCYITQTYVCVTAFSKNVMAGDTWHTIKAVISEPSPC